MLQGVANVNKLFAAKKKKKNYRQLKANKNFGINLLSTSGKKKIKNGGLETGTQKPKRKILYALLKDQWLGLVLFHSSLQVPEQLFLMKVFKTHVRVYAKMDFFLFEIVP